MSTSTLCRLWRLDRRDGQILGFTDHDRDLSFDGVLYRAGSGLGASALQQSTGLAVDNSEAAGALSGEGLGEADLVAGRYDGAEVRIWLADWTAPGTRTLIFRGTLGEVVQHGTAFRTELRGLTEGLGQERGRSYIRSCSATLGDADCGFDLGRPGYAAELPIEGIDPAGRLLEFVDLPGFEAGWFGHGRISVLAGAAAGLSAMIKADRILPDGRRQIELWQSLRAPLQAGNTVRLSAGCDRQARTCRAKFGNFLNFRGFPHLPSEDWLTTYPRAGAAGGSLTGSQDGD